MQNNRSRDFPASDGGDQLVKVGYLPDVGEQEQIQFIQEAESADAPSAFTVSQAEIDAELRSASSYQGSRLRIYTFYQQEHTAQETVTFLRKEYGTFGHSHKYLDGSEGSVSYWPDKGIVFQRYNPKAEATVRWSAVEKRIRQLIQEGSYLSPAEFEKYQSNHLEDNPEQGPEVSAPVSAPQAAESEAPPPASEPVPLAVTQADIDEQLRFEAPLNLQNLRIYELFQQDLSIEARVEAVAEIFGRSHVGHPLSNGIYRQTDYSPDVGFIIKKTVAGKESERVTVSWADAEKRLRQLIEEGRYLTPEEMGQYRQTYPDQVKTESAQMPEFPAYR